MKADFPSLLLLGVVALLLFGYCTGTAADPTPAPIPLELPPVTTTGAGTWGCEVNGQVWTASNSVYAREVSPLLHVINMRFEGRSVDFALQTGAVPGVYQLDSLVSSNHAMVDTGYGFYPFQNTQSGTLTISRLDRQAGVIAGTFEFTMVGSNGQTLRVTDGRFDIGNMGH
jgi:Family of unknown function (DUF6252)